MAESIAPIPLTAPRVEQIFPTLSAPQIERFAAHIPCNSFELFWAVTKRFRWLRISGEVKFQTLAAVPKAQLCASTHNVAFVTDLRSNLEEQDIGENRMRATQNKNLCPLCIVSKKAEGIMPSRPSFKIFVSPEDTHGNTSARQRT